MKKSLSFFKQSSFQILISVLVGVLCGFYGSQEVHDVAGHISDVYIKFLKLVSTPLIFLSIGATLTSLENGNDIKMLGRKVLTYALITTVLAALIGLALFLCFSPRIPLLTPLEPAASAFSPFQKTYKDVLLNIFPSNFVGAFLENNVIALMIIAFLIGIASLGLEESKRAFMKILFGSLFDVVIRVTGFILKFIPLAIGAFMTLFIRDQRQGLDFGPLGVYFVTVVGANLLQGFVVLPVLLKIKGYSPWKVARGFAPALSVAFFTKSSNAALPTTLQCAQKRLGLSKKISNFSLPLCVTCNMNGCAAFILITVLCVASSHGLSFSPWELITWVGLATLAAVGNAGVPMGCYFLSTAFLSAMNVPLTLMGLILPLYAFIDMVETALNVWSDGVITAAVHKDLEGSSP